MKVILVKLSQTNFFLVHKVFTNKVFYIFWIKWIQNTTFGFTLYGKNFFNRENEHWNDVNYLVERYQPILNFDEYSYKLLYDQFHEYKLANENEINLEEAIISEYNDGSKDYRMDIYGIRGITLNLSSGIILVFIYCFKSPSWFL